MPLFDRHCGHKDENGYYDHITEVLTSTMDEGINIPCPECNEPLKYLASTANLNPDIWQPIKLDGLHKRKDYKGTGSDIYSSRREIEQELKEQRKFFGDKGVDKDCERHRQYKQEAFRKKVSQKVEKLMHEVSL